LLHPNSESQDIRTLNRTQKVNTRKLTSKSIVSPKVIELATFHCIFW